MSGSDLVAARFPTTYPFAKALGLASLASQANVTVRSNAEIFGLGNIVDGALAASEVGNVIAVPVEVGDVISKITLLVGATKGKKVEAGFAALYSGALNAKGEPKEQALLAQSKSAALGETVAAEKALVFTLEQSVQITAAMAPNGYIYVVVALEAETVPSALTVATPKACQAAIAAAFANSPAVFAGTAGAGLKTKAEANLGAITSKAVAPLVFLS